MNLSKNIAIIPARKGSKGLPGKNIMNFCEKPLIYWSINIAKKSQIFDEIVVSTDCENIAEIADGFGANVPFIRPKHLSTDTASPVGVVLHTLNFFKNNFDLEFKNLTLLEPTSPLREKEDLINMQNFLNNKADNFDAIVSLGKVSENPCFLKKLLSNNEIRPFSKSFSSEGRRQDQPLSYFPYGVAYMTKVTTFLKELSFYPPRTAGYVLKEYQCMEIDSEIDFICCEAIAKKFMK